MLTPELLLSAGYRAFKQDNHVADNTLYSKTFFGPEDKRLYSVHVTFWRFGKHFPGRAPKNQIGLSCEARLYLGREDPLVGNVGFTLECHLEPTATIHAIEKFYALAYARLGCVPDLHNNND